MENQIEKKMENEMETVIIMGNKESVHRVNTSLVLHVAGEYLTACIGVRELDMAASFLLSAGMLVDTLQGITTIFARPPS